MNQGTKDTIKYISKVVLITLLIVFTIRCFFFESFTISTSQMESALIKGDEVLVSKVSYGPRLPITPLSIPFTFDKFLGTKSYSDLIEFSYKRLFASDLERNDVVLFNSSLEIEKPLDKRGLLISRCVAVPGDTIKISDGIYYINGRQYVHSPTLVSEYITLRNQYKELEGLAIDLDIEMNNVTASRDTVYFTLNRYDAFILSKNTTVDAFYRKESIIPETLLFIVPSAKRQVSLSKQNLKLYRQIIEYEKGDRAKFESEGLYIDGKPVEIYTFEDDYYWMLSDNSVEALDSRELGFIPYKNVIGKATTVLYSTGQYGLRSDRFFMSIR